MSVLNPNIIPYPDQYVKMVQKMALNEAYKPTWMSDSTLSARHSVSEMKATLTLAQITREMSENVGAPNFQVSGRRCIVGELLHRLGLLDSPEFERYPDHGGDIAGSWRIALRVMGGSYSDEFEDMLVQAQSMNDQRVPWGEIGKRFGLAA